LLRQCMSKVYCISYSDFGALITDGEFDISIVRLDEFDYPVYEDVLLRGKLHVKRRFLNRINSVFDEDAQYEAELPSEIKRLELSYDGLELYVIPGLDFNRLFEGQMLNEYGMVLTDLPSERLPFYDDETLSEDIVMLCPNGVDLNDPLNGDINE